MVVGGAPGTEGFEAYVTKLRANQYVRGIRQVLHVPQQKKGHCLSEPFVKHIRLLGTLGYSFDLCMRTPELSDGVQLAKSCPGTKFIVDHCGNARPSEFCSNGKLVDSEACTKWQIDMDNFASLPNVTCKISGIVPLDGKIPNWTAIDLAPIAKYCLETFNSDRVVFGSDWPVCNISSPDAYRKWVASLFEITKDYSLEDRKKLFSLNALKLYRLE